MSSDIRSQRLLFGYIAHVFCSRLYDVFNKKENEAEEAFKKQLETVANDPAVKANAALSNLIEAAVKKVEKSESIRSIASNLDTQLRSNFAENELPKAVISLQLDLARYSAVGANGVVLK